ncbi:YihY/virulence factor BrkB family protein [Bifidobacterium sp. 64T4]|uniref:YihY/virulence factor BrkB family protein n=1 Tax=Bifidobacterium pongonis TaxID=2834432 RepID=UPI001C5A3742|nr:YhjD/YihY/BrkB family envelope integrity protein [Bifidobacterium pongonis]MBW3094903.1 YihY/virulence factor BrkB family protein [Bifidobacterium pongonis]
MGSKITRILTLIDHAFVFWNNTFPGRIISRYGRRNGGTLANGMAYNLLFAFFSGIWTVFAVVALFFTKNIALLDWLVSSLEHAIPGLSITDSMVSGVSFTMTWTGVLTFCIFVWKVLCCLDAWRNAAWTMMDDPKPFFDPFQIRLWDGVAFILVALLFIVSSIAGVVSGGIVRRIVNLLQRFNMLRGTNTAITNSVLLDLSAFTIGLVLNVLLIALMFCFVARIRCDRRLIVFVCLIGGLSISVLQLLGSRLLGGATSNPLLAPFSMFIGVLIWFSFIAQILMYCAAFIGEAQSTLDEWGDGERELKAIESRMAVVKRRKRSKEV